MTYEPTPREFRCNECREFRPRAEFPPKPGSVRGVGGICVICRPLPKPKAKPKPFSDSALRRMCKSKNRYGSRSFALAVAVRSAKRAELIRIYKCPACNGWHLTSHAEREAAS